MLRRTCQNIFQGYCLHKESDHYAYIYQLEQAAFNACRICQVLWHAISDQSPARSDKALEAARIQEAIKVKPISQYHIKHQSSRSRDNIYNVSELYFTVNKDGIGNGGRSVEARSLIRAIA